MAHLKNQKGFTLIEILMAVAIGSIVLSSGASFMVDRVNDIKDQNTAQYQAKLANAAERYIRDNLTPISGALIVNGSPAAISLPTIRSAGYLSSSVSNVNPYRQTPCVLVRRLNNNANNEPRLEALVVTEGGAAIPEKRIPLVAAMGGAMGGYVPATAPNTVQGAYGIWSQPLTTFNTAQCSGSPVSVNRLAYALYFDGTTSAGGVNQDDVLHRVSVPGRPDLNRMNVSLDMGTNSIANVGSLSTVAGGSLNVGDGGQINISNSGSINLRTGSILNLFSASGAIRGSVSGSDSATESLIIAAAPNESLALKDGTNTNMIIRPNQTQIAGQALVIGRDVDIANPNNASGETAGVRFRTASGWNVQLRTSQNQSWLELTDGSGIVQSRWYGGDYTANGRITTGEWLQILGAATEGTSCPSNGLIARTGSGSILACQNAVWRTTAYTRWGSQPGTACSPDGSLGEWWSTTVMCHGGMWKANARNDVQAGMACSSNYENIAYDASTGDVVSCKSGIWQKSATVSGLYQCPLTTAIDYGGGDWASYGCVGQVANVPYCYNHVWGRPATVRVCTPI